MQLTVQLEDRIDLFMQNISYQWLYIRQDRLTNYIVIYCRGLEKQVPSLSRAESHTQTHSHTHTHTHTSWEVAQCNLLLATEQLQWSRCRCSAAFKGISTAVMDGWVPLVQFIHSDPRRHRGDSNWWLQSLSSWRIFTFSCSQEFRRCEHNKSACWKEN